ncbi:aminotransferase DegT [Thalassospira profundimaris]|nr:aminotransferase DegT [Thalassospira profundimaris]
MKPKKMSFIDLSAQRDAIRGELEQAIAGVLDRCDFIMGEDVSRFEEELSKFCNVEHVISCANGTDALQLVLMAEDIGPGDAVFVPSMTFVATAEVVPLLGATPVFVDVEPDTFTMDVNSFKQAIVFARECGLVPRVVIPVDLFGQPADYSAIASVAREAGVIVVADAAQSMGGQIDGVNVGALAEWTTTSFFPAKPLGCYGDGGAVFTNNKEKALVVDSLRLHGKSDEKYNNVRVGVNSRLDTIQAAILLQKLAIFPRELEQRNQVAARYDAGLSGVVSVPHVRPGTKSAWAQYTLRSRYRDQIMASLLDQGIPTMIYYPIPLHQQKGYAKFGIMSGGLPVSEALSKQVFSLPMHPYLQEDDQEVIIDAVVRTIKSVF